MLAQVSHAKAAHNTCASGGQYVFIGNLIYYLYNCFSLCFKMKNQIIIKKLGVGIRKLRKIRDIKVAVLAQKLGYLSVEAYLKLERGEKNDIGIVHLLAICEELNCSISNLFILSGLTDNLFNKEITSWSQFLDSLTDVPAERKEKILELLNTLNFSQSVT